MLPRRSLTRSFVWRIALRIRASSGEAPSNISSSPSMQRSISSSTERWVLMYSARLLSRTWPSSRCMDSFARRAARRHFPMPISSPGDTKRAACMRFKHSRISGKASTGERPMRINMLSASAVRARALFTSSKFPFGHMASASSWPPQVTVFALSISAILSYSSVFNTLSCIYLSIASC